MSTKKLVTVGGSGAIPELGYICAPIINPCPIDIDKVSSMVNHGRKVYAVNPNNTDERVLLTPSTVYEDNFAPKVTAPETKTVPAPVEKKVEAKVEKSNDKQSKNHNKYESKKDTAEVKTPVTPDATSEDFFSKK